MTVDHVHESANVFEVVEGYAKSVPKTDELGYSIPDTYLGQRRPVKVLVIGFGASGINLVHVLGQTPGNNITIQCYDKNPEVGGTWYENRFVQNFRHLGRVADQRKISWLRM